MLLLSVIIVWNAALAGTVVWLYLALRERTFTVARVLEIHTEMLKRVRGELAALQPGEGLRYGDAVIPLPTDFVVPVARHRGAEQDAACQGIDSAWEDTGSGSGFPIPTDLAPPK